MNTNKNLKITKEEYSNICKQWANKKITTSQMFEKLKGTEYEAKKEEKKQYNKEIKCDCNNSGYFLNCIYCQKRIEEEGYSQLDLNGENYWENEADYIQYNFERFN